jgi:phospholipid/cholesterol/gamma-HCH transport system ATP-binding protein
MTARRREGSEPMLAAHGIVNRFGRQALHDRISLEVQAGEIVGVAGGSGSGKSVLLKTLVGLHKPQAGKVLLAGRPVSTLAPAERASLIGVLFQQGALFSSLTVAQNVMLPLREHTALTVPEQERIAAMKLELAGLAADSGAKFPAELSGGMVKRAALARALALDPRVLFLDEPTADLDPLTAGGIDTLIGELNRSLGLTVVIVTHDLATLFTLCHRIAVLVDGKLVIDTLSELRRSQHPWIREFLHGTRAQGAMAARKRGDHGNGQALFH